MKRIALFLFAASVAFLSIAALADEMVCVIPNGKYVNVRVDASKKSNSIGELRNGDRVFVESISGEWLQFRFDGRSVYSMTKYFESKVDADYSVVANGRVRVRNQPNGDIVGWVQPDSVVHVTAWRYDDDGVRWARIGSEYIHSDMLQAVNNTEGDDYR